MPSGGCQLGSGGSLPAAQAVLVAARLDRHPTPLHLLGAAGGGHSHSSCRHARGRRPDDAGLRGHGSEGTGADLGTHEGSAGGGTRACGGAGWGSRVETGDTVMRSSSGPGPAVGSIPHGAPDCFGSGSDPGRRSHHAPGSSASADGERRANAAGRRGVDPHNCRAGQRTAWGAAADRTCSCWVDCRLYVRG